MKYGFIADVHKVEDYVFGAGDIPNERVLVPNGDWTLYLPTREIQHNGPLETMNCTVYGTLNALEMLFSCIHHLQVNYSERFTGVLAGTTRSGNSPHTVAETIRHEGVINDAALPFSSYIDTWDEYYSPKPMTEELKELGLEWLNYNDFKHDWVFTPPLKKTPEEKQCLIRDALRYSPLGVSVQAWRKDDDGVYIKDKGGVDNHWCVLFKQDDHYNWVFDSYDSTIKKLSLDYDFQFAKRYVITRQNKIADTAKVSVSFISRIRQHIVGLFHRVLDIFKTC